MELTEWLYKQAPVVVVMAVCIWWLAKRLLTVDKEKNELAKKIIELTTMWEAKADKLGEADEEFQKEVLKLLSEIKGNLNKK